MSKDYLCRYYADSTVDVDVYVNVGLRENCIGHVKSEEPFTNSAYELCGVFRNPSVEVQTNQHQ